MDELTKTDAQNAAPVPVSYATLSALPQSVSAPRYDRAALTPGIVHIGVGNFHRAHQAWYIHRLMQTGQAFDWGIIGAGVRPFDETQRKKLFRQDNLTTLIELDPSGTSAEVIGSMIDFLPVEEGNASLIRQMSDQAIRIVSMTVTEGGYFLDPATKRFDASHPEIQHDIENPGTPKTAFGAIVAALGTRRAKGLGPFTCQSCDNLPGNGDTLREVVTGLAQHIDPLLADWIKDQVSFPNSMVDCIVPATGPDELALSESLGIQDIAPVTHENFRQWVIEDSFCAGRPAWEDAGVTMSNQVHAYEDMKLRLLNAGHQIIAAPAEIMGLNTIAEAMDVTEIKGLFRKLALTEIAPHVSTISDMSAPQYVELIQKRFSNAAIKDTVRRVAFDGSSRQTGAVFPIIRDAISSNAPLEGLALSQALWARMCLGTREDGTSIEPNDPSWAKLNTAAEAARIDAAYWLKQSQMYGVIADDTRFCAAFSDWLEHLYSLGVRSTLALYLDR